MSKREFLDQLSFLLRDISEEERKEALDYYTEYIEDAGFENEESVVEGLGSVEELAREIKAGITNKTEERRSGDMIIKTGTYSSVNNGASQSYEKQETNPNENGKKRSLSPLAIILLIFTFPIWLPVIATVFGVLFGLGIAAIAVAFAFAVSTFAIGVSGIALLGVGFVKLFVFPLAGVALLGSGFLLSGIALLVLVVTVGLFAVVLPACFRAFGQLINWCGRKLRGER